MNDPGSKSPIKLKSLDALLTESGLTALGKRAAKNLYPHLLDWARLLPPGWDRDDVKRVVTATAEAAWHRSGREAREVALWALVRQRSVTKYGTGDEERAERVLRGGIAPDAWGRAVIRAAKKYPALANDFACRAPARALRKSQGDKS